MAIVTITRGLYSGGEELAESIASSLGAQCYSSEVLAEASKNYNVPETKISQVFEKSPTFWERLTESRGVFLSYIQATLAEWARKDDLVYHGNAGQELLREVPHVLKVRLLYPTPFRVNRISEKFGYDAEKSKRFVEQIDEQRTKRMEYLFNTDWRDPSRYDLVLRMEKISKETAKEIILALLEKPEFQLDDEKKARFNDFVIKCRVYALLAGMLVGRLSLINVTVNEGVVRLDGALTSQETLVERMVAEVEGMEGVTEVHNEITIGLVYHEWNV